MEKEFSKEMGGVLSEADKCLFKERRERSGFGENAGTGRLWGAARGGERRVAGQAERKRERAVPPGDHLALAGPRALPWMDFSTRGSGKLTDNPEEIVCPGAEGPRGSSPLLQRRPSWGTPFFF